MPGRFATTTGVSVARSRAEIEEILTRYGASGFAFGTRGSVAMIGFEFANKAVRFELTLPDKTEARFGQTPTGRERRNPADAYKAWEQECRSMWRALLLAIKAKLETVETGISTFEAEFMAHIVMPDGRTFKEHALPAIEKAACLGRLPNLSFLALPAPKGSDVVDVEAD